MAIENSDSSRLICGHQLDAIKPTCNLVVSSAIRGSVGFEGLKLNFNYERPPAAQIRLRNTVYRLSNAGQKSQTPNLSDQL